MLNNFFKYKFSFFFFKNNFFYFKIISIFCKYFFYFSRIDIKYFVFKNFFIFYFKNFIYFKLIFLNFNISNNFFFKKSIFYIPVLYEGNFFAIINKPFNIIIHSSKNFLNNNLVNNLLYFYGKKIFLFLRVGILNRLDKDTTGLFLIFKKFSFYLSYLNQIIFNSLNRFYIIYVFGYILNDFYFSAFFNLKFFNNIFINYKKIFSLTKIFFIKIFKFFNYFISFLKINTLFGRTHQIRIHFNYLKKYILCDKIYNSFNNFFFFKYINRQAFHLFYISFFFFDKKIFFLNNVHFDMFNFYKFLKNFH